MSLGRIKQASVVKVKTCLMTSKKALSVWAITLATGTYPANVERILEHLMLSPSNRIEKIDTSHGNVYRWVKRTM